MPATNGSPRTSRTPSPCRAARKSVSALLRFANRHKHPGHAARRRPRLRRRLRAGARRHRALAGAHEPHQGNQRRRFCGRRPAGREHAEAPGGGREAGPVLSARPRQPRGQLHRRQHRHQRRRPALPQIRRHPRLRPRPGSRAGRRHGRCGSAGARTRTRPASICTGCSSAPKACWASSPKPR